MANYILLERIELNASASSVTFSNIPQSGYTDLKVVASIRGTQSANYIGTDISFNGTSTTTNWSRKQLEGGDGTVGSYSITASQLGYSPAATMTANTFSNIEMYIPNYTSSNYKSVSIDSVGEGNQANAVYSDLLAELWSNTAAINSITFSVSANAFAQYSTFSLYGLAAVGTTPAIAPKASGGNITTDGTYWYHAFISTGAFTPFTNLTCDALVVAGGGAGSGDRGAGGGAGGFLGFTSQSFTSATAYTCTVGAGGTGLAASGSTRPAIAGTSGTNSQVGALTAVIGGGAGGDWNFAGSSGGSGGGGGGMNGGSNKAGGTATSGQGNAGGDGFAASEPSSYGKAGGGGGAGSAGTSATSSLAGAGGAGSNTYSSWATATTTGVSGFYAGGGGGGADLRSGSNGSAGSGGAGAGGGVNSGTANTGSGGGGGSYNGSTWSGSGNGGSGIVIVRYTIA